MPLGVALLVTVCAGATLLGVALWPLIVAVFLPWAMVLASLRGALAAISGSILASGGVVVLLLVIAPILPWSMLLTVTAGLAVLGLAGAALVAARQPSFSARPENLAVWLPSALGGLVWLSSSAFAALSARGGALVVAIQGDSANNVLFARKVLERDGIVLGPSENPVPLPSALLALAMAPGRDSLTGGDLIRHDITMFAGLWAIVIALTCLLTGAVAGALTLRAGGGNRLVGAVSAAASLVPLTWFVTGYPIEFGFFNAHVTLVIVVAAFASYLVEEKHPAVVLALLMVAATLILTVWSPFVLLPAALGLVLLIRHRRSLLRVRGFELWLVLLSGAQMAAWGLLVVVPSLLELGGFLKALGGAHSIPRWILGAVILVAVILTLLAFRSPRHPVVFGFVAVSTALLVGLGLLLFISRNEPVPWTYYPLKFMWLATVVMVLLSVGLVSAVIVHRFRSRALRATAFALAAVATVGFFVWVPGATTNAAWFGPLTRVVKGSDVGMGDEVVDTIASMTEPGVPHLFWKSEEPASGLINFWLLQMWDGTTDGDSELRRAAYGVYDPESVADLCRIIELTGGGTVVHTSQADLVHRIDESCSELGATVVVSEPQ